MEIRIQAIHFDASEKLEKFIQTHHSYEVPEIVGLSVEKVSQSYLNWAVESLKAEG